MDQITIMYFSPAKIDLGVKNAVIDTRLTCYNYIILVMPPLVVQ